MRFRFHEKEVCVNQENSKTTTSLSIAEDRSVTGISRRLAEENDRMIFRSFHSPESR
jgi:hypothetical protein